ncbi:pyridoxal-dependent decarboxylase [Kocuria sp. JC486]|uniref:pyridoxal phosphate-dependent decarboxylase family protein n=1 Tax=Kocuria sp. JC486 TaxID=1970736 RepID=UPI001424A5EE|nr:pyridoxal-dependent decarboxylase [Kocuria sp. JC486]NHU84240.1 pyridoxal-dependent decarboxylase [Kocuria sp. JC486]
MTAHPADPLLSSTTVPELMAAVSAATATGAARLAEATDSHSTATYDDLRRSIESVSLDNPLGDFEAALDEVDNLWLSHAVWFHLPRTAAHLNCPVAVPAVAAEALAATVNTSVDTWDQSTAATLIERQLLAWTGRQIGFPEGADGMFTPGGTTSTLQALLLARDEALERSAGSPGAEPRPVRAARLRILASAESHFSVVTAARILGLDDDAVVIVPVDEDGRMRPRDLRAALCEIERQDLTPMAVVATAGTTDRGAIDPLSSVAFACQEHGVWLHVDAAYGGGLLTSHRHRHRLIGIEMADSVTVDFHKTWFQPVSCSAVIVRDPRTLRHCTHHAAYLNPADTPEPNQIDRSLQTTRRFDALKVWLTLRSVGADRIGDMLDTVVDLAAEVADLIGEDPRFELICTPSISTVLFRWSPPDGGQADRWTRAIRRRIWDSGQSTVAETEIDGRPCLKFTLLNPAATAEDLRVLLGQIHEAGLTVSGAGVSADVSGAAADSSVITSAGVIA